MREITIKDIAKACGLSVATVSRVLGGSTHPVSSSVRARVEETARELGYRPNILARSLKRSVTNEVAVLTPSVINPFYTSIIKGIEQKLCGTGYGMVLYITGQRGRSDDEVIHSLRGKMVAGVIAASDSVSDELFAALCAFRQEKAAPVIYTDYRLRDDPACCGAFCDYAQSTVEAAAYLLQKGHRRIAFASLPLDRASRRIRYEALSAYLAEQGIPLTAENTFFYEAETSFHAGKALADRIADSAYHPTAVVAINDTVASGILAGLAARGVAVPEEISVIGFDNAVYAEMCYPPLTTVHIPAEEMGEQAAAQFLAAVRGETAPAPILLDAVLVERGSVTTYQNKE